MPSLLNAPDAGGADRGRFFELAPDLLCVLGSAGEFVQLNSVFEHVLGWPSDALIARLLTTFVHEEDRTATEDAMRRGRSAGARVELEHRFRCRNGSHRWLAWRLAVAVDGMTYAVARDVTERRCTEAALRASERFNDALLEASPDCVQLLDLDGRLEHVSLQGQRLLEIDHLASHHGVDWAGLWTVEGRHRAAAAVDAARAGGVGRFHGICPTCKGTPKWWDVTVTPVRDGAGNIVRLLVVGRDVTEAKMAEERLGASEERYRSLTASSPVGVFEIDARFNFLYANPKLQQVWGMSDAEIAGRGWIERVHPADIADLLGDLRSGMAAKRECATVCRLLLPDGAVRRVQGRAAPRHDAAGIVVGMVGTIEDVTAQWDAAQKLAESEARHRSLFDNHPDAVYLLDPSGRFVQANPACEATVEQAPGTLVGQLFDPLLAPEQRAVARRHFAAAVAGVAQRYDIEIQHESGRRVELGVTNIPVIVDESVVGVFGIAKDMTAQRALEAQLRQAQKMEAVGQLAGGIAHDFNNLLTVITSYTMMLLTELPSEDPLRHDLQEIQAATERATGLTRQLLAFSRQQVLSPRVIDLPRVVGDMESFLRRLIGEHIQFSVDGFAEPVHVHADPGQIEQVVMNLAVNARDAMPTGGSLSITTDTVVLSEANVQQMPSLSPGLYARVCVRDTGCGMDEETRGRIFEPFYTTKEPGKGTGLGLATAYGIVEQSGGAIQVDSVQGVGTTFRVFLPHVSAAPEPVAEVVLTTTPVADRVVTVLLVEDEDAVRTIVQRVLRKRGYTVLSASNGPDALLEIERHAGSVDLLITDVVMPKMSGQDLARRLTEYCGELPVLFMSGYSMEAVANHGVLHPGARLLNKPFNPHDLALAVSELLNAHRGLLRTDEHPECIEPMTRIRR